MSKNPQFKNAAREQQFEPFVGAAQAEAALQKGNHAERGKMPFVEHDRIAQRNRARVVRVGIDEIEQRTGPLAVAAVPCGELSGGHCCG